MGKGQWFTEEFRVDAIKQVSERSFAVKDVSKRLGVSPYRLYQCIKRYGVPTEERLTKEDQAGQITKLEAELRRVSDKLRRKLQTYVKAVPFKSITEKLFYSQKRPAEGWNSNTLRQYFHHLFKNCGISGASSYSPRRTAITNLADKGISVRVLQSIARPANVSTT